MARFYDKLIVDIPETDDLYNELKSTTVISGDEVAKYYIDLSKNQGIDFRKDIPVMSPPFDNFFVDISGIKSIDYRGFGVLFKAWTPNNWDMEEYNKWIDNSSLPIGFKNKLPKWIMLASLFIEARSESVGHWLVGLDNDGQIEKRNDNDFYIFSPSRDIPIDFYFKNDDFFNTILGISFMTISFMHCKNITIKEILPPEKVNRKRVKNNKKPLVRYHVLNIEPMKTVLKRVGNIESNGFKKAIHICRGHFKNYQGAGLFGKHKGLYWWDMHLRGNKEEGLINKDYKVSI